MRLVDERPAGEAAAVTSHGSILVVDDDVMLTELISEMLGMVGYSPLTATTLSEADEILDAAAVDVLITDCIFVGEPAGIDFARRQLREERCRRAIVMSGANIGATEAADGEQLTFLLKPFRATQLCALVDAALDRSHTG